MTQKPRFRVFATCDIGKEALGRLRQQGYEVEVYDRPGPPPKRLIVEKARSGVEALITTLLDQIDAEVFAAGQGTLKVVAQDAVGFDNINRTDVLKARVIAGAALDVFETESLPPDSPLRDPALEHRVRLFHHFGQST